MAPTYKLTYFNIVGLAEPIRYIMAYSKVDYTYNPIEHADWPKLKPETPFGVLPLLEVDGKTIWQNVAICRFLAKRFGLTGKTEWDAVQADVLIDTLSDFRQHVSSYAHESDEKIKATKFEELKNNHVPYFLGRFDKTVAENGGYFVNGQLTWADLYFTALADRFATVFNAPILDKFSNLKALREKVNNLPGIKEYLAARQ